jgi:hypothetical protein
MLVHVITRYPRPALVTLQMVSFQNEATFGTHSVEAAKRYLGAGAHQNQQLIGQHNLGDAPRLLAPAGVMNLATFGTPLVEDLDVRHLHPWTIENAAFFGTQLLRVSRRHLAPSSIANVHQFGSLRVQLPLQVLSQTRVVTSALFGAHQCEPAEKRFSYSNPLGSGNRTGIIAVSTSGGTTFDSPSKLVNGNLTENAFWGTGAVTFKFDLAIPKVIRQARWHQNTSTAHFGLFQWSGSNDDVGYAEIGAPFALGGATVSLCNSLNDNQVAYRYYRLAPAEGGSINATPYLREIEFYIEGEIDDLPD